jgi:hypothetical protein
MSTEKATRKTVVEDEAFVPLIAVTGAIMTESAAGGTTAASRAQATRSLVLEKRQDHEKSDAERGEHAVARPIPGLELHQDGGDGHGKNHPGGKARSSHE